MEREYGHRVELVEGYRSPERQQAIFAQGRTQPGPVATWTRDSLHTQGRAADLQVDGSWDHAEGYAHLQRIAAEEGLRVLGNKDPGHVELPGKGSPPVEARRSGSRPLGSGWAEKVQASVSRPARVAAPARPPGEATVRASVASAAPAPSTPRSSPGPTIRPEVAPTARVAPPGAVGGTGTSGVPGQGSPIASPRATAPACVSNGPPAPQPRTDDGSDAKDRDMTRTLREPVPQRSAAPSMPALSGGPAEVHRSRSWGGVPGAEAIQRPGTAERVDEILSMGDAWDSRAPGRVLLDLQDADGAGTRIRLALRGSALAGSLDLSDPALADRMRRRIGELHEALSRQGLDARAVEARVMTGLERSGRSDGDLAALTKDPLQSLARMMDTRSSGAETRSGDQRHTRQEPQRGWERFRDTPQRDRNKEEQR